MKSHKLLVAFLFLLIKRMILKLFRRGRIESLPPRNEEPQITCGLFIFANKEDDLKVVLPRADRTPAHLSEAVPIPGAAFLLKCLINFR